MKTELEYLTYEESYHILLNLFILCIFRYPTLITFISINEDNIEKMPF